MKYYLEKTTTYTFDKAIERVKAELVTEGFSVLTEADLHNTFKEKFNIDFRNYKILQVCNPPSAFKSTLVENKIGNILPCNIIIQQIDKSRVDITITEPVFPAQHNDADNKNIVKELREKMKIILDRI